MGLDQLGAGIPLRRETGFLRGVPIVELWIANSDFVFRRVTGIWDTGAVRTLLAASTFFDLLGFVWPDGPWLTMESASAHRIEWQPRLLHFRAGAPGLPAVHFPLIAGVSKDIVENLFGADMIDYFAPLVQRDRVTLYVDDRLERRA